MPDKREVGSSALPRPISFRTIAPPEDIPQGGFVHPSPNTSAVYFVVLRPNLFGRLHHRIVEHPFIDNGTTCGLLLRTPHNYDHARGGIDVDGLPEDPPCGIRTIPLRSSSLSDPPEVSVR